MIRQFVLIGADGVVPLTPAPSRRVQRPHLRFVAANISMRVDLDGEVVGPFSEERNQRAWDELGGKT
jgi:hypothetical protein